MKTTIIYAHPYEKSFNNAVLQTVKKTLSDKDLNIIDLYEDGFNPALEKQDLKLFNKGETTDELIKKYQKIIKQTDNLVFIFPIWWAGPPAILKGFIDKVMLKKFAYVYTKKGLIKGLLKIDKATILTTSQAPKIAFGLLYGNPIKKAFGIGFLKTVGVKRVKWINFSKASTSTQEEREKHLKKIEKYFS